MQSDFRAMTPIQQEKTDDTVYDDFRSAGISLLHDILHTLANFRTHRNIPHSVFSLRLLYIKFSASRSSKLPFNPDTLCVKVYILQSKAAELADSKARPQKNNKLVVIFPVSRIILHEIKPVNQLLVGQRLPGFCVIRDDYGQVKIKGISLDYVFLVSHPKSRSDDTFYSGKRVISIAIFVKQLLHPHFRFTR